MKPSVPTVGRWERWRRFDIEHPLIVMLVMGVVVGLGLTAFCHALPPRDPVDLTLKPVGVPRLDVTGDVVLSDWAASRVVLSATGDLTAAGGHLGPVCPAEKLATKIMDCARPGEDKTALVLHRKVLPSGSLRYVVEPVGDVRVAIERRR